MILVDSNVIIVISPPPDIYIGAHAAVSGLGLLTRDARRYSGYFPRLRPISPD